MTELAKGLIIRGITEEEVREAAANMLESGEYDPCLAPVRVSGTTGAGPVMMVVLECKPETN